MIRILRYLKNAKKMVCFIFVLLIVQAYCDLKLPEYTSDIVDVGIQQSGIEMAVPTQIRGDTLWGVGLFLEESDTAFVESQYEETSEGVYTLIDGADETRLSQVMSAPLALCAKVTEQTDLSTLRAAVESGAASKEQFLQMKEQMANQTGYGSMLEQKAILTVRQEYEALGMDLGAMQTSYLLRKGGMMLLLTLVMIGAAILTSLLAAKAAAGVGRDLRGREFRKVVSFSNGEMGKFSTASLITRSTNDIQQIQMVSVLLLRMVSYAPILGIGGVIKVLGSKTGMGWIIVVAVAIIFAVVFVLMRITIPKFQKMQSLVDRLNLVSREILTGVMPVRAFGREQYEEQRFDEANEDLMKIQLFTSRMMSVMMPFMMLIMNGITILVVWVGAKGVDFGTLQVGDMMAFITYTMLIVMSFLMLTMVSIMLPRAGVAARRIDEVLAVELTIQDKEAVLDDALEHVQGVLQFDNVSFRFPGAEEDTLEKISFTAQPRQTTAIIGSTGCGKSTLLHLIPRFYDVTEGKITIDGVDIRDISQKKLRSFLGFVPQRGILFSGDIASNLKFGDPKITDEEMVRAAEIAQAADFIGAKEEGYQSPIAQGGSNVSGGQKQRLSIARAIAKHPKIFLFDDSFSALDYQTDAKLRKALAEFISDATVLIVAQRISTILHADQILVLEEGKIVGKGTHQTLMETCSAYQEIARSQFSEEELKGGRGA